VFYVKNEVEQKMTSTRLGTSQILVVVGLLFFVHFSSANILDSPPPPPLFNSSHFPNGGIDWSNIGFPDVSSDCLVELARMSGGGLNQSYSQSKFFSYLLPSTSNLI
jgi:hypothetical protein